MSSHPMQIFFSTHYDSTPELFIILQTNEVPRLPPFLPEASLQTKLPVSNLMSNTALLILVFLIRFLFSYIYTKISSLS